MIWIIGFALILAASVFLGTVVGHDPGYLLIAYQNTTIEAPLWLGIAGVLALFFVLYFTLNVLQKIFDVKARVYSFRQKYRLNYARNKTNQGLIEIAEGHWSNAEKLLINGARYTDTALLNYLAAAKAAQAQGANKRRDRYLRLAHDVMPGADMAISLTQAQLQYDDGQLEQCLATLQHLKTVSPTHTFVLQMLKKIYIQLKDWEQLQALLPELKRHKVIARAEYDVLNRDMACHQFTQLCHEKSLEECQAFWQQLPRSCLHDSEFVIQYAQKLASHQEDNEAEIVLRLALKKHWDDNLIVEYGLLNSEHPKKQLSFAEGLLKTYSNHPKLLLTLGRLSIQNQLWGKAQRYFEASLAAEKQPQTYAELGLLLEQLNQTERSADCFREGLMMKSEQRAQIAAPVLLPAIEEIS